ncbi:MAG TPA: MFS transporter, partial [Planctomycetota bacterium]|nr:MFS transporter [Planctomycetota bacterium]
MTLASVFGFASLAMAYSPTLSLYAKDLGASPLVAGILFSVAPTFGILLRIPAGALSTLIGRKKLMTVGATTYLIAPLVLLTTDSLPVVFLSAFLFGFANLYMPAGISLVNDVVPEAERGEYIAYYAMWGTLGRAGAPFLAGFLIDEMGYRYVFIVCAGMGLVSFLYTLLLPPSKGEAPLERSLSRQVLHDLVLVVRHRKLLWASVFRGSQSLTQGIMNSYFPWYARDVAGLGAAAIGQIQTGLVLGGIVARPLTGKFSVGRRRIPFMVGGMLGSALLLVMVTHTTDYLALMAICFGIGIVEGICQIATVAYLSDASGVRMFGAAIGVLGGFFDIGLVGGRLVP